MTNDRRILIQEHNIISLRTAFVTESDGFVALQLLPEFSSMDEKPNVHKTEYHEWLNSFQTILYQHISSGSRIPFGDVEEMLFEKPPELKLHWTDSGNSVAVYLNGEPWAFIDEKTQKAYSKGVLTSRLGTPWTPPKRRNPWDQQAFDRTFMNAD